jgi:hypothetical protein
VGLRPRRRRGADQQKKQLKRAEDRLDRNDAMACRWVLLGVCLERRLVEPARTLVDELRPLLLERAPALAAWLDAALAHGGRVPATAVAGLPALVDPPAASGAWAFPERLDTVEALREAALAGSVLMHPRALADRIARQLERTEAKAPA